MDFAAIDLKENQELARIIVKEAISHGIKKRKDFERLRNRLVKEHKATIFHNLYFVKAYKDLVAEGGIKSNLDFLGLIQKRGVRTISGVAPVTVMTKPFPCPGRCVYCPTDVRMPKSYLPTQPAAQRAFRQQFNPYTQVFVRLKALSMTGHEISKVELRVIGGTWSSYTKRYQKWFLKKCLQAMNEFSDYHKARNFDSMESVTKKRMIVSAYGSEEVNTVELGRLEKGRESFDFVVKKNETSSVRCIGINVETRPDFIDKKEVKRLRSLGVTKVEMGVQTTDDRVQELTMRGHDLASVKKATKLLKDAGFKIGYHMMPNLPGATPELDRKMIGELFSDQYYQPDYLKIYPCVVLPKAALALAFRRGDFVPYDDATLEDVLLENIKDVPEWCRVDRIARDIPSTEIEAGFKASNIRQILEERLRKAGTPCRDIRAREIMGGKVDPEAVDFVSRSYDASDGKEYFLSYEDVKKDKLVALLRLRFPSKTFIAELKGAALVREVHVYGRQVAVGSKEVGQKQHLGWGTRLLMDAEELARKNGYKKLAIIAGIGTREYYKKKGYDLEGSYMVKSL